MSTRSTLGWVFTRTAAGDTPVLDVVKQAEQRLLDTQQSKAYVGTAGAADFNAAMQQLAFADTAAAERLTTVQTPGGSGSLRVAAGMIMRATHGGYDLGQRTDLGEPPAVDRQCRTDTAALSVLRHQQARHRH